MNGKAVHVSLTDTAISSETTCYMQVNLASSIIIRHTTVVFRLLVTKKSVTRFHAHNDSHSKFPQDRVDLWLLF